MREIRKLPMKELDTKVSFAITTSQTNIDKKNDYIFLQTRKNEYTVQKLKEEAGIFPVLTICHFVLYGSCWILASM